MAAVDVSPSPSGSAELEHPRQRIGPPAHRLDQELIRNLVAARPGAVVLEPSAVVVKLDPPAEPLAVGRELNRRYRNSCLLLHGDLDAVRAQNETCECQQRN